MSEKILKIKRLFAFVINSNLENTPPKAYPSTAEIKTTINDIIPALKENTEEYKKFSDKATEIRKAEFAKEMTKEESDKAVETVNKEWRAYTDGAGSEILEIKFSEEAFKVLKDQFERDDWGKNWTGNLTEFKEMSDAFTEAGK